MSNKFRSNGNDKPVLGVIGCGNIGGRHALNFSSRGYLVVVYDIVKECTEALQDSDDSIVVARDCADLASRCDIVFTALSTPDDVVHAVLNDQRSVLKGIRPGSVYVDVTTNSPDTVLKLFKVMADANVEMLDCPFNDSPQGAKTIHGVGLSVMVGGNKSTYERVLPVLTHMADRVIYCGPISSGTRCKLIHNAVNACAVQAVCEGITIGLANDLPLQVIWDSLRFGSFGQNAGDVHGIDRYWFSRRCDDPSKHPAFTVKLLGKDLRICAEMAATQKVKTPHLTAAVRDFREAERRGWSHYACTKVNCLQEERAGVRADANAKSGKTVIDKSSSGFWDGGRVSIWLLIGMVAATNAMQYAMNTKQPVLRA